jgi:hypothetical protein
MRRLLTAGVAVAAACALFYLRDPAWLIAHTTGLRPWERSADGTAFRWSGPHASFFVPSDARAVLVPISTTFGPGGDQPMVVTITIDDEKAARVLLENADWKQVTLTLPPRSNRRVRRVDVRTSITREDNHGVRIGELKVSR